jgi:MFS family permease
MSAGADWRGRAVPKNLFTRISGELRTLPRQFWLLAAGTLVYLIGVEMAYPFETIYLNRNLSVSMTKLGLILGITLFATLPVQIVGGTLCDRIGRRPVLIVAILGSMTLYIGLGLTRDLWLVIALIAFEAAFGWAQYITASNAMIADLTTLERRAEAFSVSRVALNIGVTIGPLIAAPLIILDPSFRLTFLAAGAVCGIFLLMVIFFFKETRPTTARSVSIRVVFGGYGAVLRDRRMLVFCLVALLPPYGFGQIWVTMPIMLGDLHGVSAQQWGLAMVIYGAATAILQYPVVRIVERRDHMLLMALASLCIGLGLGGSALAPWPWTLAFVALISLGIVLFIPFSSTIVSHYAPAELRGRYMGVWTLVYMGGYAIGPLIGGWALDALGGRGAFLAIAVAGVLGALLFPLLRTRGGGVERDGVEEPATAALSSELRGERPEQAL